MASQLGAYAMCISRAHLDAVVEKLISAGISSRRMLVVVPQRNSAAVGLSKMKTGGPDSPPQLEGVLTWLMKFGAVVIAGVGIFIAGNIFSAALLSTDGPTRSGHLLRALGIAEVSISKYETRINNGGMFLYIDCDDASQVSEACELLHETDGEDISSIGVSCEGEPIQAEVAG